MTTSTTTAPARPSFPATAPSRTAVWARGGGTGIALGGALLLAATVVEALVWDGADLVGLFAALFITSITVLATAMLPLALGSTGADGIAGGRMLGTIALLAFGAVFATNQMIYFVTTYGPASTAGDTAGGIDIAWLAPVLGALQLVLLLTAAIVVARAGIATGAARWALLALSLVAMVTGIVATLAIDPAVTIVALISSTVTQVVTGIVLLAHRTRGQRGTVD